MLGLIILLAVVVVGVVVLIVMRRNRSTNSSVDSFRRHIDALGPEARRTTVDQVQNAAARSESVDDPADTSPTDEPPTGEGNTDEGGARGT